MKKSSCERLMLIGALGIVREVAEMRISEMRETEREREIDGWMEQLTQRKIAISIR